MVVVTEEGLNLFFPLLQNYYYCDSRDSNYSCYCLVVLVVACFDDDDSGQDITRCVFWCWCGG